ncbi:MAG: hypothetical protein Q8Q35_01035 [Nanoarchaeota archaeon]|nr:hypothetical protein [Nanoarchaeota archaeon]
MSDFIITYEKLYEILRREKYRTEIQEVTDTFFEEVVKYMGEKKAILDSQSQKDSIFASKELEKTQTQIKNVQRILKELYEKRENKILQTALFASRSDNPPDTSNMLPEELALFQELKGTLDSYRSGILINLLKNKSPQVDISHIVVEQKPLKTEEKTNTLRIQILEDVPEFVGPDLQIYGPYPKESTLDIPDMIANLLIQTKQAKNENP